MVVPLTAIPILVSMLYRFPFSLIFTAIIAFVTVFPWLAITVTFCCFLARWRPFRFQFRFATALLALLPVALYYAMATRNADVIEHLTAPAAVIDRIHGLLKPGGRLLILTPDLESLAARALVGCVVGDRLEDVDAR